MKLFGIEIKKTNDAAEPKRAKFTNEIGDSGTRFFQGIIDEEYNDNLVGTDGIEVYDKMRKGDATVKAAVLSTSLPIRRAHWVVEPASDDPQDTEIAEFIEKALFEWQSITWNDLLRQALLSMPFGVMVFEKVFTIKQYEGRDYICWKKIAPRMPRTISAWEMEDGKPGIQQLLNGGGIANIPMEKLLVFVNDKEGDNWWGTSILRSAYKHWRFKDGFYNIDAVAFERQGLGIPKAKMGQNASDEDNAKAATILKNLRAHEQQYIIEPFDIEVDFMDMKGKQVRDPEKSIQHHNREIAKAVLAQFLELGATDSGSRALSVDQTDLFLQSLEAVAGNIADVFNTYAIKQLVDLNFDNVQEYPQLKAKGISRVDAKNVADAYQVLTNSGAIIASDQDEIHFREILNLPYRDMDEEPNEERKSKKKETPGEDEPEEVDMSLLTGGVKKKTCVGHSSHKFSEFKPDNRDFARPLTFAEEKVDFNAIQNAIESNELGLSGEAQALLLAEGDRFMKELSRAINNEDLEAIKKATFKAKGAYTAVLKRYFKQSFLFGKNNAAKEMDVNAPANPKEMLQQIDLAASTIADRHASEFTTTAKLAAHEALTKGESAAIALAAADKRMRELIQLRTGNTAQIAVAGYINYGRMETFKRYENKIYALQRSEILDSRTCNYCLSLDGRIVEKNDSFARNTIFHSGCRGIWVEILEDEEQKPDIEGIPQSLRDKFGDAVNDLVQPKTVVNKKDSDAKKEEKKRRNRRIDKQK